ncbi:flagellin [Chthonomonas calidirosea]
MLLTENGNASATTPTAVAQVSANMLQFQVGGNAGQVVQASLGNIRVVNLGNTVVAGYNLSNIDVTTSQGAENAIQIVDEAISQVSQLRANLGALQSQTLQATANYLGIGVQNLSASESQIRDTNVAQEVVNLTKNQIIEQSATAMLAQANAAPQLLLKLLG